MTTLEELIQAAMAAPQERRDAAFRVLRGELPKSEPSVTLRRLAQLTGFGVTTLRRWRVPGHEFGGARRYKVSEVEAYMKTEAFERRCASLRAERKAQDLPTDSGSDPVEVGVPKTIIRSSSLPQPKTDQPASQPRNGGHIHAGL